MIARTSFLTRLTNITAVWLATGGGVGFIPFAPGTWGTAVAIPLLWLLKTFFSWPLKGGMLAALIMISIWAAGRAQTIFKKKDSQKIVVDEIAGFLLAMLFIPLNIFTLVCGFLLFRIFDIAKIPPANLAENLEGGLGIVADDLVAGGWTYLVLRILLALDIATTVPAL